MALARLGTAPAPTRRIDQEFEQQRDGLILGPRGKSGLQDVGEVPQTVVVRRVESPSQYTSRNRRGHAAEPRGRENLVGVVDCSPKERKSGRSLAGPAARMM